MFFLKIDSYSLNEAINDFISRSLHPNTFSTKLHFQELFSAFLCFQWCNGIHFGLWIVYQENVIS